jgi:elongation factor 1 alpha-like protein
MSADDDDWDLLDSVYDTVASAVKATEADIVDALRRNDYDADLAIAALFEKRKRKPVNGAASNAAAAGSKSNNRASPAVIIVPLSPPPNPVVAPARAIASSSAVAARVTAAVAPIVVPAHITAILKDVRPSISVAVIGHVDAGKSTLLGRLMRDLHIVSARECQRLAASAREAGRASFALAWLLDEGATERSRGVTVDVAEVVIPLSSIDVLLLDAPGHRDFVPAMITAVAQADAAVLVVDATAGGFEAGWDGNRSALSEQGGGGLTREHILLARSLGVTQLIVAVNKIDASEIALSSDRFNYVRDIMMPALLTAGFNRDAVVFVPVSGLSGLNVARRPAAELSAVTERRSSAQMADILEDLGLAGDSMGSVSRTSADAGFDEEELRTFIEWYGCASPSLVDALNALRPSPRNSATPLRFCISDANFSRESGASGGVRVSGRVEGGWVESGATVAVYPGSASGIIRSISRRGCSLAAAGSGSVVDLLLAGFEADISSGLAPGTVLAWPIAPARECIKFKAKLAAVGDLPVPIVRGQRVTLHTVCCAVPAVISRLLRTLDGDGSAAIVRPRVIVSGCNAIVRVVLAHPIALDTYANDKRLGRFVLRYAGKTIAAGKVTKLTR